MLSVIHAAMGQRGSKTAEEDEETTHALTWMTPDRIGTAPSPRNGHTADVVDSKIYIFGGGDKADLLADLFVFDVRERKWSQPPCTGVAPPPRSRHTSAVVGGCIYIWGGIGGGMEMHVLDARALDWTSPNVHGTVPDSRFGHTCTAVDAHAAARLFIIGGHNSREALSDVHVFDVGTMQWSRPPIGGDAPVCGNRHVTVPLDDETDGRNSVLLVFAADMHDTFGTLYGLRYREASMRWLPIQTSGKPPLSRARPSVVTLGTHIFLVCGVGGGKPLSTVAMLDKATLTWTQPSLDGMPPPSRMGATATLVGTDIFVFGGNDGKASLRDLHVLVYVTWFNPVYSGRPPPARVGHTCTMVGSKLYLLGGATAGAASNDLFVLDPPSQVWSRPPMYGAAPEALVGHSACVAGTELFVWGGGDGRRSHNSLHLIDTVNMLWSKPATSGAEPLAHVGHTAVHVDAKMFVFGGYGQQQYWNELVVLDTGIMSWMRPHTTGTPPVPCVLHSATMVGEMMVVYGGAYDEQPIEQLVALDVRHMRWANVGNYVWEGIRPPPRFGHGAAAIGSRLFVFGGTTGGAPDKLSAYLLNRGFVTGYAAGARNELVVLDMQSRTFAAPRYAGAMPPPAYRQTVAEHRGKFFVFGGVGSNGSMAMLDTGLGTAEALGRRAVAGGVVAEELGAAAAEIFHDSEVSAAAAKGVSAVEAATKGLSAGAAAELVSLLQELGLNKYARLFLRQEVDVDSLLDLSDADLRDMGLTALGARRKLTAAIHRHRLQRSKGEGDEKAAVADAEAAVDASHVLIDLSDDAEAGAKQKKASSARAVPGQLFRNRYDLTGKSYLGGSARVILGDDIKTGRKAAVKMHSRLASFTREVKLLRHLKGEFVVELLDVYQDEEGPPAIVLEGGSMSLHELLKEGQLRPVERKLVLERLCLALQHVHAKAFVVVDFKPQNVVVFDSLLGIKLIDLECLRKQGEPVPFKLTPCYAAPELAAAALETMRVGQLPELEWSRVAPLSSSAAAGADRWGPNLQKLAVQPENPTLARAVAAASLAAGRAGGDLRPELGDLRPDEVKQIDAVILQNANGKPLRASAAMDMWSLGLILYELFACEPYFAGCSDDVALQVLASTTPLDVPMARVPDTQAQHLVAKLLVKQPRERASVDAVLKHAYLCGGLDTQQVAGSFAMLHEAQQSFRDELGRIQGGPAANGHGARAGADLTNDRSAGRGRRGAGALADKRAQFAAARQQQQGQR